MNEPVQLTENLSVTWEGDVKGYAPAIELWNRALARSLDELLQMDWLRDLFRDPPAAVDDLLPNLLMRSFVKAGAEKVWLSTHRSGICHDVYLHHEGRSYLIGIDFDSSLGDHKAIYIGLGDTLSNVQRKEFDGIRCVFKVGPSGDIATETTHQSSTTSTVLVDVNMIARWSHLDAFLLQMSLQMGLSANSARLASLRLVNTGPADELDLDPLGPRMNIITGDNGLGKSFFLEAAWFMLTGHWHNLPAVVTNVAENAHITARLLQSSQTEARVSNWIHAEQGWGSPRENAEMGPGLIVYARVDGSFSVWDCHRNVQHTKLRDGLVLPPPRVFPFSFRDVMYGLKVWLDDKNEREVSLGLINEWREWQIGNKPQFELLKRILAALGPDGEPLTPGTPSRPYLDDAKDIPTIQMGYGQDVPITLAPAGVKRVAMLAYVLTWAISEHQRIVRARAGLPARSVVLLIDEPETHLHPRWQRTILPSLLKALEVGFGEPKADMQMFVATHSPLVLASLEPHFDPALDALWKLDLVDGEVKLERDVWHKRGDANAWLTSDVFDMSSSRSVEAEQALKRAKALALRGTATQDEIDEVQAELERSLTDTDRAWRAWESFVEHLETQR